MNKLTPEAAASLSPNTARYNLRDYGGYAMADGARLCTGRLFRSGQLDDALPEDRGLLARLGVTEVVDLRSAGEASIASNLAYEDYAGAILAPRSEDGVIPHAIKGLVRLASPDEVANHMVGIYRTLPGSVRFREAISLYFRALAESDGASFIHCFAGKDRTGLAVALFHLAMGVHADDMMEDYLLTNAAGEERIAAGIATLRGQSDIDVNEAVLREAMGVRPEFLTAALEVIAAETMSPATWICQMTGLGSADLEEIRCRYSD